MKNRDPQLIDGVVGIIQCAPIKGMRAKFVRQSTRTGGLTVRLLESRGAYVAGNIIHVCRFEFVLLHEAVPVLDQHQAKEADNILADQISKELGQ